MSDGPSCDGCRFHSQPHTDNGPGQCRRRAPSVMISGHNMNHTTTEFPEVWGHQWCGEFVAGTPHALQLKKEPYR